MHFEEGIVGIGFARQKRLDLTLGGFRLQRTDLRFTLVDGRLIALHLAEFDQRLGVIKILLEFQDAVELVFEIGTLARDLLRSSGIVPEVGVLDASVQFEKAFSGNIPVKDASSAARLTAGWPRPSLRFRHA